MRWKCKQKTPVDKTRWHVIFAWLPRRTPKFWVWLEHVERIKIVGEYGHYQYRIFDADRWSY